MYETHMGGGRRGGSVNRGGGSLVFQTGTADFVLAVQGGNSIGFLDGLTDRLKLGDGLKMSDFGLGMS